MVLHRLQTYHPRCQLSLTDLFLPSLSERSKEIRATNHELKLISQNFDTLKINQDFYSGSHLTYCGRVYLRMMKAAGLRVKAIIISSGQPDSTAIQRAWDHHDDTLMQPNTDYFNAAKRDASQSANVEESEVEEFYMCSFYTPYLDDWMDAFTFSRLRTLHIEGITEPMIIALTNFAVTTGFSHLTNLDL